MSQGGRHQDGQEQDTRYVWAIYGTVAATGKWPGQPSCTIPVARQHMLGSRRGLDSYNDDPELVVGIQSRALEANTRRQELGSLADVHGVEGGGDEIELRLSTGFVT